MGINKAGQDFREKEGIAGKIIVLIKDLVHTDVLKKTIQQTIETTLKLGLVSAHKAFELHVSVTNNSADWSPWQTYAY